MLDFARENPVVTLMIIIVVLGTVRYLARTLTPWARRPRTRDDE